jgi:hypothetical protein
MFIKARTQNMIVEEFGDECVVYDVTRKKAHCLNGSVKWIWEQCDGSKTAEDISKAFEMRFGASEASILVSGGLSQLEAANLLSNDGNLEVGCPPVQMTRRDAVAAASFLVPLITSIVVPTPAAAKSSEKEDKPPKEDKPKKDKD